MCRTFSKIYGLAALRLGWLYGPAHVVDALNRIRGPFNVNAAAIAAGIAALARQRARGAVARAQREMARLAARRDPQARARGDAEHRQFRTDPFPGDARAAPPRTPTRSSPRRGLILRRVKAYKLPNALRMTVGSEEANRLVVAALAEFMGNAQMSGPTHFQPPGADRHRPDRLLDRARRARAGRRALDRRHRALGRDARGGWPSSASPIRWSKPTRQRSKAPISSSSASRSAPAARSPRRSGRISAPGAIVSDVGSVKGVGRARHVAAHSGRRAFRSRPSGRRHRAFRPGCGLRRAVRQPLVHPHAAAEHRAGRGRAAGRVLARCSAPMSRPCRPSTTTSCSPSPATCRI